MQPQLFRQLKFTALAFLVCFSALGREVPEELKNVGITENLGAQVSIHDLTFSDETGKELPLASFFRPGHPVLLSLVYYECPSLCTFVLNGTEKMLKEMDWVPGKQFDVVSISINPEEKPALAAKKKQAYLKALGKPEAAAGWHFLTGREEQIRKVASELGFRYAKDRDGQYAHSAALFALTPEGRLSRILFGIEYDPKAAKLALLEASNGKIGTVIDRILMFCYRYDPLTRKYSVYSTNLVKAGGALTVLLFGGYLGVFWLRQRRGREFSF